jgi:hypothetical protein
MKDKRQRSSLASAECDNGAVMADANPLADPIVSRWFTRIILGWVHTTVPFRRLQVRLEQPKRFAPNEETGGNYATREIRP